MSPLLLTLTLTAGAPAIKEKPAPASELVGEWVTESVTVGLRPDQVGSHLWSFRAAGTWSMSFRGRVTLSGTFRRDGDTGPGTLDLLDAGRNAPDRCRYRVTGDTLVLSVGHDKGPRPNDLEPAAKATVWVFKRVKDR
jgi:hypothetical protein